MVATNPREIVNLRDRAGTWLAEKLSNSPTAKLLTDDRPISSHLNSRRAVCALAGAAAEMRFLGSADPECQAGDYARARKAVGDHLDELHRAFAGPCGGLRPAGRVALMPHERWPTYDSPNNRHDRRRSPPRHPAAARQRLPVL